MPEEVDLVGSRLRQQLGDQRVETREHLRLRVDAEGRVVLVHPDVARGIAVAGEAHGLRFVLRSRARRAMDEDDRSERVGGSGRETAEHECCDDETARSNGRTGRGSHLTASFTGARAARGRSATVRILPRPGNVSIGKSARRLRMTPRSAPSTSPGGGRPLPPGNTFVERQPDSAPSPLSAPCTLPTSTGECRDTTAVRASGARQCARCGSGSSGPRRTPSPGLCDAPAAPAETPWPGAGSPCAPWDGPRAGRRGRARARPTGQCLRGRTRGSGEGLHRTRPAAEVAPRTCNGRHRSRSPARARTRQPRRRRWCTGHHRRTRRARACTRWACTRPRCRDHRRRTRRMALAGEAPRRRPAESNSGPPSPQPPPWP